MNQKKFHLYNKPNEFLLMDVNYLFLYQIQMVRLLNKILYHSKAKMKGLDNIYYLTLLYFSSFFHEKKIIECRHLLPLNQLYVL